MLPTYQETPVPMHLTSAEKQPLQSSKYQTWGGWCWRVLSAFDAKPDKEEIKSDSSPPPPNNYYSLESPPLSDQICISDAGFKRLKCDSSYV